MPTRLARLDRPDRSVGFKKGAEPVTVTGSVVELALWVFGRSAVRDVTFDGPPDAVARLQGSDHRV